MQPSRNGPLAAGDEKTNVGLFSLIHTSHNN